MELNANRYNMIKANSKPPSDCDRSFNGSAYLKSAVVVVIGAMMLLWIALFNGQPFFFFGDTPTYVREIDTLVVRAFGPRFATPWTLADVAQTSGPRFAASPTSHETRVNKALPPNSIGLALPQVKHTNSADSGVVLAGKSVYYGALLYMGELAGGFWLSVFGQALVVAYVIFILAVRCYSLSLAGFLISITTIASISTVSFFVAFLMPDIFAGVTILVTAILIAFWDNLKRFERVFLALILAFAVMAHVTHLLICGAMLGIYIVVNALSRFTYRRFRVGAVATIAACVAVGLLGELAFNLAVYKVFGVPPIRPPFVMARLIDMGPGYEYLKDNCSDASFTVCQFLEQLPLPNTETFLWSHDPGVGIFAPASPEIKRALGEEQYKFAIRVLMFDPIGVTLDLLRNGLRQLGTFGLEEFHYHDHTGTNLRDVLPAEHYSKMQNTILYQYSWPARVFTIVDYFFVTLSLMLIAAVSAIRINRRVGERFWIQLDACRLLPAWFFATVAVGIVVNALICGDFSEIHDRYQARVIWLIPLTAVLLLVRCVQYGSALPSRIESNSLSSPTRQSP